MIFIFSFSSYVDYGNILLAGELLAIRMGLQKAWAKGFKEIVCESDLAEAVRLVNSMVVSPTHLYEVFLVDIANLKQKGVVRLYHMVQLANAEASLWKLPGDAREGSLKCGNKQSYNPLMKESRWTYQRRRSNVHGKWVRQR
ncbi:hypothetical protein RIF29_07383 [Crotalaria pallida]|uniref:RNase H type-1 domain-containing protein n=1 Tax=Crotalaria pallida TaxID=3830 RepID=A0AAN9J4A7_CROPI